MARKMEGDWQARMALALKKVWAMVKEAQKNNKAEKEDVEFNEWARYGHHRVYFKGRFGYNNTVRNAMTNKLVDIITYVDFQGFYDVEKGYIKLDKCQKRHEDDVINYINSKLVEKTFNMKAEKVA